MNKIFSKNREAGVSMISTIVALGVIGIATLIISSATSNFYRDLKSVEIRGELLSLRKSLQSQISCEKTFQATGCVNGMSLRNSKNAIILTNNSKFPDNDSPWEVVTYCNGGNDIDIKIKRGDVLGNDPLTNLPIYKDEFSLFGPDMGPCKLSSVKTCSGMICGIDGGGNPICSPPPSCGGFICTVDLCGETFTIPLPIGAVGAVGPPGRPYQPPLIGSWGPQECRVDGSDPKPGLKCSTLAGPSLTHCGRQTAECFVKTDGAGTCKSSPADLKTYFYVKKCKKI